MFLGICHSESCGTSLVLNLNFYPMRRVGPRKNVFFLRKSKENSRRFLNVIRNGYSEICEDFLCTLGWLFIFII